MHDRLEEKEKALVEDLKMGSRQALATLYNSYADKLYHFCLKISKSPSLAEDVVQDVFVRVWNNRTAINSSLTFESYLFTIARNRLFDLIKRASKESKILDEMLAYASLSRNSVEQTISFQECSNLLNEAIASLPSKRQLIFKLSREEGLSYAEIARQLEISPGTVNIQIVKALKSIRDYLDLSHAVILFIILFFR